MDKLMRTACGALGIAAFYAFFLFAISTITGSHIFKERILRRCPDRVPFNTQIYLGREAPSGGASCSGWHMLGSGWSEREATGVWTTKPVAHLMIPTLGWPSRNVNMHFSGNSYAGMGFYTGSQKITVSISGEVVGSWILETAKTVPDMILTVTMKNRENRAAVDVMLETDPVMNPKALGVADDNRDLGLNLRSFFFD